MSAGEATLGSMDYNSEELIRILHQSDGIEGGLLLDNDALDPLQLQQVLPNQLNLQPDVPVQPQQHLPVQQHPPQQQIPVQAPLTQPEFQGTLAGDASDFSSRPYVAITEQPKSRGQRFRYKCEGRSAGSIPGEHSTDDHRTFPTIQIMNYDGPSAIVVVSCVTKDEKPRPHPHSLVGQDCSKGVCTIKLKGTTSVSFPNIGIQCSTKRDVQSALQQREKIRVDPFGSGYFVSTGNIDLNVVKLCFQVFLPDEKNKYTRIVEPVVSQPIYDKKAVNDLVICRVSRSSGTAKGGDEIFMLCEKVSKDDIQVRFFEVAENGDTIWEGYADFSPSDVHRQYAICFKTPRYKDPYIKQPVQVHIQLKRPSDSETSDAKPFLFTPDDPDPDFIQTKRKRKSLTCNFFNDNAIIMNPDIKVENKSVESMTVKERLKLRATKTRPRKQQAAAVETKQEGMKQYSFQNTGSMLNSVQVTEDVQQPFIPAPAATSAASMIPQNIDMAHDSSMLTELRTLQMPLMNPNQQMGVNFQEQPLNDSILNFINDDFSGGVTLAGSDLMTQAVDYVAAQETVDEGAVRHPSPHHSTH